MSGSPLIFIAHVDELMERFDPRYVAFCRRAAEFRYPLVRLSKLLSAPPEYGAGEAGVPRIDIRQPRYIRITDVNDDGELSPGLGATAETVENRYILHDGDLLFARSGATVGKCYLHESEKVGYPCFYAGYMIRFRLGARVLPNYVFAFTQTPYYHDWVAAIQRSAAQPNINAQEYSSLQIPVPPLDVQKQIVAELDAAYEAKRNADEKASRLLASIDEVIFSELGIPPLPPQDTSLRARMFIVPTQEVVNKTLAPTHYMGKPDFSKSKYACRPFYEVVKIDPMEIDFAPPPYKLVPMDAVSSEYGNIDRMEEIGGATMGGYSRFRDGDVIFAKISPCMENGKSAVVSTGEEGLIFGSTEFYVLRPKCNTLLPEYLHLLLRMKRLRECAARHLTGTTGHQRLSKLFLNDLEIPVPPLSMQHRIVEKVTALREEAKRLKLDAAEALAAAKFHLENQLL